MLVHVESYSRLGSLLTYNGRDLILFNCQKDSNGLWTRRESYDRKEIWKNPLSFMKHTRGFWKNSNFLDEIPFLTDDLFDGPFTLHLP